MSDNSFLHRAKLQEKQRQVESKMQEIREIEMLPTISEDETDKELVTQTQKNFPRQNNESQLTVQSSAMTPVLASSKIKLN